MMNEYGCGRKLSWSLLILEGQKKQHEALSRQPFSNWDPMLGACITIVKKRQVFESLSRMPLMLMSPAQHLLRKFYLGTKTRVSKDVSTEGVT
jgi:hypothetical protein